MRISGIYKIQSKVKPKRIYVGSAGNIHRRWIEHKRNLSQGVHCNAKLQNHANKYGMEDLQFSLIVGCDADCLIVFEQFYIDSLMPWFNICPQAGSTRGLALSEDHKRKIGESMSGDKNPMYGRPAPIKGTKGKCPNKWKGKTGRYSEEALIKRGIANKLAWEKRKQKQKEESRCQE